MATANFQARLERIQASQTDLTPTKPQPVRTQGVASVRVASEKRRSPIRDHFVSLLLGLVLGALAAVALIGLTFENSPWALGTPWHDVVYYIAMAGLGAAPILMLLSLFMATRRPGFALFSLGYLSGVMVPMFL